MIFVVSVIYVVAVVVVIVQVRTEWLYSEQCQFVFSKQELTYQNT